MNPVHPYLRLDTLKRFLKLKNWRMVGGEKDRSLVYEGPRDDTGRPVQLELPAGEHFADTPSIVAKAVKLLAAIEDRSVEDMGESIRSLGSDFLRQRIMTPSNVSTISLAMASRVIKSLSDLVFYAACLEEDAQPFFVRGRNIGKRFLEKCRFGQTFVGSFGLALEMPIAPCPSEDSAEAPFERRIMMRLARGMVSLSRAAEEADIEILTRNYQQGFNANLCETMLDLAESVQNAQMEFTFSWSPEYTPPQELKSMPPIRFMPEAAIPFLESAAKSLRKSSESQDTVIRGRIVQLRSDSRLGEEEAAEDLEGSASRMIVVEWETEKGRPALIRAALSPEAYAQACNAHRDGKAVSIRGKPEKLGKHLILTAPADFTVLS